MTSTSTRPETTTTKRISDEVFAEVERELASEAPLSMPPMPAKMDRLDRLAGVVLPYVWATAIGVWAGGLLLLRTVMTFTQCISITFLTTSILCLAVFAWRSLPARAELNRAH